MDQATIAQTKNRIRRLRERLKNGWDWLENPENQRNPKFGHHEDVWIALLREYEEACDTLAAADVPKRPWEYA